MPSGVVSCATAPPPSGPNSPVGVARCSRCSRRLENSNSANRQDDYNGGRVMASKDNVFVVLSLSGGNDGLNTVIPYTNGLYRDFRPHLGVPADQVIPLND